MWKKVGKLCTNKHFTWHLDTSPSNDLSPSKGKAFFPWWDTPMLKCRTCCLRKWKITKAASPGFLFSLSKLWRPTSKACQEALATTWNWTEERALGGGWTHWEATRGKNVFLTIFIDGVHHYYSAGKLSLMNLVLNDKQFLEMTAMRVLVSKVLRGWRRWRNRGGKRGNKWRLEERN